MGCWGITAFESDAGLDAVGFIKKNLPKNGKIELETIIEALRQENWNAPPDVEQAGSHTSAMALAEIMVKFIDRDIGSLDRKFSTVTSFSASRESLLWLQDYISGSLQHAKLSAKYDGEKWGGWFEKKNCIGWQEHMKTLTNRLDMLLAIGGDRIELIASQQQQTGDNEFDETCAVIQQIQ